MKHTLCPLLVVLYLVAGCSVDDHSESPCLSTIAIPLDSGTADGYIGANRLGTDHVLLWAVHPPRLLIVNLHTAAVQHLAIPKGLSNGIAGVDVVIDGDDITVSAMSRDRSSVVRFDTSGTVVDVQTLSQLDGSDGLSYEPFDPILETSSGTVVAVGADTTPDEFVRGFCLAFLDNEGNWWPLARYPEHVRQDAGYTFYYPLIATIDSDRDMFLVKFRQDDSLYVDRGRKRSDSMVVHRTDTSRFSPASDLSNLSAVTKYELTSAVYNSVHYLADLDLMVCTFLPAQGVKTSEGYFSSPSERPVHILSSEDGGAWKETRLDSGYHAFFPLPFADHQSLWVSRGVARGQSGAQDTLHLSRLNHRYLTGECEQP